MNYMTLFVMAAFVAMGGSGCSGQGRGDDGGKGFATVEDCNCSGVNEQSQPVTIACNEQVCGNNNYLYTCTANNQWTNTQVACGGCTCTSINDQSQSVTIPCQAQLCGSNRHIQTCTANGQLTDTQVGCGDCTCSGVNEQSQPVTIACNEQVCGNNNYLYTCTANNQWTNTQVACGGCTCTSINDQSQSVTIPCQAQLCGSNRHIQTCTANSQLTDTQVGCGDCTCSGVNEQSQSVTIACNEQICANNHFLYTCAANHQWTNTQVACSECNCSAESAQGSVETILCGESLCGADHQRYTCSSPQHLVATGQACGDCDCASILNGQMVSSPCGEWICNAGLRYACSFLGWSQGGTCEGCGDGVHDAVYEECDDYNDDNGDGCSSTCHVTDQSVVAPSMSTLPPPMGRALGEGRHPVAADAQGISIALLNISGPSPAVEVAWFDAQGVRLGSPLVIDESPALYESHPVVAALPSQGHVVVWTSQDDDERGVWMRAMPTPSSLGAPVRVNLAQDFDQSEPDVVWSGDQLVVAWVDSSSLDTGEDIHLRRFDDHLTPLGGEEVLAATEEVEGHVALASFQNSWAAAWRASILGLERIRVQAASVSWSVGPFVPGPSEDRPALARLDDEHLVLFFSEGVATEGDPAPPTSRLRVAVLSTQQPGELTLAATQEVAALGSEAQGLAPSHPMAVRGGDRIWLSWRTEGALGEAGAEELWLKPLSWTSSTAGPSLDLSAVEMTLPRQESHRWGDQRRPGLAVQQVGAAQRLVAVWEDLGKTLGTHPANHEVALEVASLPLLRNGVSP